MDENQNVPQGTTETPVATAPTTGAPTHERNTLMAVLAYISILVLIPYFTAKEDPFVRFHIKQGLVLLTIGVIVWAAGNIVWMLFPLLAIINLGILILTIIGIINAIQGNEKELPLVGSFSKYFDKI